jgi:23S rRNA (pseudouridine1915-N3)-methyltransferase
MKFKMISIGKIKNKNILSEIDELKKRISRIEHIELKEIKDNNIEIIKKKEFEIIKNTIKKDELNILLWEHAKEYSTKSFYDKFKNQEQTITFIITGAFGGNEDLKNLISNQLSLSQMTFTHEIAQLMLIEQIYRLECFSKNIPYTK